MVDTGVGLEIRDGYVNDHHRRVSSNSGVGLDKLWSPAQRSARAGVLPVGEASRGGRAGLAAEGSRWRYAEPLLRIFCWGSICGFGAALIP